MATDLVIALENGRETFRPGEAVFGTVSFTVLKPAKNADIKVFAGGWCKINVKQVDVTHPLQECYLEFKTTLWGRAAADHQIGLKVGDHCRPFRFKLPETCPSTFECKYGNVWYSILVERNIEGCKKRFLRPIFVYDAHDLSVNPRFAQVWRRPQQVKNELAKCGVSVDITVDKTGYVPSEVVILNGHIENRCSSPLSYKITLTQQVTVKSNSVFDVDLVTWIGNPVPTMSKKLFQNQPTIKIPGVVASFLRNCKCLSVEYFLKFDGTLKRKKIEISKIGILIGGRWHRDEPPQVAEMRKDRNSCYLSECDCLNASVKDLSSAIRFNPTAKLTVDLPPSENVVPQPDNEGGNTDDIIPPPPSYEDVIRETYTEDASPGI